MKTTLLAAVLPLALAATTYHADPLLGNDANDGLSPQTAFRTLNAATARLSAGDTLALAPGALFKESLVIRSSGTAAHPITIKGNGATISGLEPVPPTSWIEQDNGVWLSTNKMFWGACRPRVLTPAGDLVSVPVWDEAFNSPEKLKPGTAAWNKHGIWFRPEAGKTPQDYALQGYYRVSGVTISDQSYITVENLTAEHFTNDGFNVHGSCRDMVFRNIVGRWNGDEGFSVHEDVMATVTGAHFHHNDNGIADVTISQTAFCGVLVESNRVYGVDFHNGIHILRDTIVRDNARDQIFLHGTAGDDPMKEARIFLEGVQVTGGAGAAMRVRPHTAVSALRCSFAGTETGLALEGGHTHLASSEVKDCQTAISKSTSATLTELR